MSRANVVSEMQTYGGGLILAFSTRDGETLYYQFSPGDAQAYYAGVDPRELDGEPVDAATAQLEAGLGALGTAAELL